MSGADQKDVTQEKDGSSVEIDARLAGEHYYVPNGSENPPIHVCYVPDATPSERRPHRFQSGSDGGFHVAAFHSLSSLDPEDRFSVKIVGLHHSAEVGWQVVGRRRPVRWR